MPFSKEVALFIGMLIGGETVLVPAMYVVLSGAMQLLPFLIIVIAATCISDAVWYAIGRSLPKEKVLNLPFLKRHTERITKAQALLDRYKSAGIILSKFVYGSRTVVQILAGTIRIPFWRYIGINTLGVVIYVFLIFGIGTILYQGLAYTKLDGILHGIILIVSLAVLTSLFVWSMTRYLQKKSQ